MTPKKDTSGSMYSEENIDSSDTDKQQTADAAESADSKDADHARRVRIPLRDLGMNLKS